MRPHKGSPRIILRSNDPALRVSLDEYFERIGREWTLGSEV